MEIERQQDLGDAGLLEEDKYLAEVNLGDMETTSGERQHYWLLAIQTAWKAKLLWEQQEQQQTISGETTKGTGLVTISFQHFYEVRDVFQVPLLVCFWQTFLSHAAKDCEEESPPLLCGFTAMLFGSMPLAYEDSIKVKLV